LVVPSPDVLLVRVVRDAPMRATGAADCFARNPDVAARFSVFTVDRGAFVAAITSVAHNAATNKPQKNLRLLFTFTLSWVHYTIFTKIKSTPNYSIQQFTAFLTH